ncbi:hypothetical protein DU508_12510 [Pedobacter chinensis]|uniref:Uncharacterized protein n=1 Tax=Pedobacter chinensis TaxID=2282421 RepID=A0A369PYY7_9SPHI|nr:hypothetical protein [Pedobacter chinensis]RDC56415.1 hypothetical protein DU508_12510 [Pedobacter chinensis]
MKKHKSRSKDTSANKKARKELESKLTIAFNEVLAQFGKAKKTEKVIEKFAKQLSKKISLNPKDDSITSFIKEEEISAPSKEATDILSEKKTTSRTKKVVKA